MLLVERLCDHVAFMATGRVVATGPMDEVCDGRDLEAAFVGLVGGRTSVGERLAWLTS
jgi:ABC-2 type transport system ATP-binding protein